MSSFYLAVAVSAWRAGLRPALMTIVVGIAAMLIHAMRLLGDGLRAEDLLNVCMFVLVTTAIALLVDRLERTNEALERSVAEGQRGRPKSARSSTASSKPWCSWRRTSALFARTRSSQSSSALTWDDWWLRRSPTYGHSSSVLSKCRRSGGIVSSRPPPIHRAGSPKSSCRSGRRPVSSRSSLRLSRATGISLVACTGFGTSRRSASSTA